MTYQVAKTVVRINHIGMVNVLAGREVVPELVQASLTSDSLAAHMAELLSNDQRRQQIQSEMAEVVATLGSGGAYAHAAEAVIEALRL